MSSFLVQLKAVQPFVVVNVKLRQTYSIARPWVHIKSPIDMVSLGSIDLVKNFRIFVVLSCTMFVINKICLIKTITTKGHAIRPIPCRSLCERGTVALGLDVGRYNCKRRLICVCSTLIV